jgi:cobalt/nickel transport protein
MKKFIPVFLALAILVPAACFAHFGVLIPSAPTVMETKDANITLDAKFWHPFEGHGMNLEKPKSFKVYVSGAAPVDLLPQLKESKEGDFKTWSLAYKIARPGLYEFVMEPNPYWEPQEDKFIIHYTKVYVDAFGDSEGWEKPIAGLKTEIVPLIKPGALYAGNVFRGRVLLDGKPVAFGEVEIEWYPGPGKVGSAPYESMVTQVALTDGDGVFSYSPPVDGWWGFAALNDADYKLPFEGKDRDVELGGVLWVYFHKFQPAAAAPAK